MTSTTGKINRLNTAFTLMEMLVVLAVIILLLGVSIPFFSSFTKGTKLKSAAKNVTVVLNTARSLSITERKNYSVVFNFSEQPHKYYIADPDGQLYGKEYILPSSVRFYRPSDPDNPTSFSEHQATFSSTGGLTGSKGAVWLSDKKENLRRITVSNTTGRVKIDTEP